MKITLLALSLLLGGGLFVQDRAKKPTSDDVPKLLANASKAFEAKRFATCARDVRMAFGLLTGLVRQQLLATMPPPPAGFAAEADPATDDADANPLVAMMGLSAVPAERTYRKKDGDGEVKISIIPDSPMAAMLATGFNLVALDKSAEAVTYKENKGVLRKEGDRLSLQILIGGKDLVDVNATGIDDDGLLKVVDQAFVDRVVAALQN